MKKIKDEVDIQLVDQAALDEKAQHVLDLAVMYDLPKEEIDEHLRQWKGGACPACGKDYRRVHSENYSKPEGEVQMSDFWFFKPACDCAIDQAEKEERAMRIQNKIVAAGVPRRYQRITVMDWDSGVQQKTNDTRAWVIEYCKKATYSEKKTGLILYGPVGTGKTHLAISVLRDIAATDRSIHFQPMADLIQATRKKDQSYVDFLGTIDAVLFDDLDKIAMEAEFVRERVFAVIDKIARDQRILLGTANFKSQEEFNDRFSDLIVSRLIESCNIWELPGDDYRIKLKGMKK